MKHKIQIFIISTAILLFASLFVTTIVHSAFYAPEEEAAAPRVSLASRAHLLKPAKNILSAFVTKERIVDAPPERVIIPSIGVNAYVQKVGINRKGNMGIPNNFSDVGWYKYGPLAGNTGSAVIAGHVDNALALDGVFKHVGELVPGAKIKIITESGQTARFVVYDVETYLYDNVPTELVFKKDDEAYLNLVTCGGEWMQEKHSYDKRIVVYAKRITDS